MKLVSLVLVLVLLIGGAPFSIREKNQKSKIRDFDRFILPFSLIFDTLLEALSPLQLNLMESVYKPFY